MRYVSTAEAARRLAISPARMKQLADRGDLPVIRTKAGWRLYREKDVERLLRQRHRLVDAPRPPRAPDESNGQGARHDR